MRCSADYDKSIAIEELRATAKDEFGEVDRFDPANWAEYCREFADLVSRGGREFWKADHASAEISHIFYCQWNSTLAAATTAMRVEFEGDRYEIVSLIDINGDHREIEIQTKREV